MTLAVGIVGCGRIAEHGYVPALAAASGVHLAAAADPDRTRREAIGVPAFESAEAMFDAGIVDAVVLATPATAHVADAARAVAAGVPVLVEKPPAPDAAGAAELVALGDGVWIGFNRRFDAGARRVRDAVPASGPIELHVEIGYRREAWAAHTVADDALTDLGPHLVDWVRWIAGDITEVVTAFVQARRADVKLRIERGRARVVASMEQVHHERITLRDSGGRVLAEHRVGRLVAGVLGRIRPAGPHPLVTTITAELESCARAGGGAPEPRLGTPADGLAVMTVLDAARECAARGGRPLVVSPGR